MKTKLSIILLVTGILIVVLGAINLVIEPHLTIHGDCYDGHGNKVLGLTCEQQHMSFLSEGLLIAGMVIAFLSLPALNYENK